MKLNELTEKGGWVNGNTGVVRYYLKGNKQHEKARVFFSREQEKATYIWKCDSGFFHADKCYNGWIVKELREMFPEENIQD